MIIEKRKVDIDGTEVLAELQLFESSDKLKWHFGHAICSENEVVSCV